MLGYNLVSVFNFFIRWRRPLRNIDLIPNCLLTRYPIAFVTNARGILNFRRHWSFVPDYLREHGYHVVELQMSAKNLQKFLKKAESRGQKFHFVTEPTHIHDVRILAKSESAVTVSAWAAPTHFPTKKSDNFYREYLNFAISLAEYDFS